MGLDGREAKFYVYIESTTMADFPKTVGPDRRKRRRTDDFKIYIGPNVR